ncbi:hypothetical protein E2C01_042721 [Portunus trituberculatus]|uniref:Uncharacterized protein n=1 Tax=Portunus trituberculatus TaxID=210409 RepID=A0A5B7FXA0_PORTR|nr:hypothetical protein [Portunus trituberculatus]
MHQKNTLSLSLSQPNKSKQHSKEEWHFYLSVDKHTTTTTSPHYHYHHHYHHTPTLPLGAGTHPLLGNLELLEVAGHLEDLTVAGDWRTCLWRATKLGVSGVLVCLSLPSLRCLTNTLQSSAVCWPCPASPFPCSPGDPPVGGAEGAVDGAGVSAGG